MPQDSAPPHQTATNMDLIIAKVPGGHFSAKPPALSPIKRVLGDSRLHKPHKRKNIEELRQTITPSLLHNLFDGVRARSAKLLLESDPELRQELN